MASLKNSFLKIFLKLKFEACCHIDFGTNVSVTNVIRANAIGAIIIRRNVIKTFILLIVYQTIVEGTKPKLSLDKWFYCRRDNKTLSIS